MSHVEVMVNTGRTAEAIADPEEGAVAMLIGMDLTTTISSISVSRQLPPAALGQLVV